MKKFIVVLIGLLSYSSIAFSAEQNVESKIESVTVFLRGAQVNRTARVNVKTGRTKLYFKGLTPLLNGNSISLHVDGDVKVLSVNNRIEYFDATLKDKRIKKLSDSIQLMEYQLEDIVTELNLLSDRERFVLNNARVKGDENLDPDKLIKVSQFYNRELGEVRRNKVLQKRKHAKLNKLVIKYRNQLAALLNKTVENTSVVEVLVEAVKATGFDCKLSFLVTDAGWIPSYDVRAQDITKPLEIAYKATVFQNTGIEWKGVKLTFSNGNPYRNKTLPKLTPHYLRFVSYQAYRNTRSNPGATTAQGYLGLKNYRQVSGVVMDSKTGEPLPGAIVKVHGTSLGAISDANGNFKLEVPEANKYLTVSYIGYKQQQVYLALDYNRILMVAEQNALKEAVISKNERKSSGAIDANADNVGYYYKSADAMSISGSRDMAPMIVSTRGLGNRAKMRRGRGDDDLTLKKASRPLNLAQIVKPVSVEFSLEELYTVSSTGKPMVVEMKTDLIKTDFEYRAIPKLDEAAYLMAMIPDWTKYNFIQGEANLYFENTYIGKTVMDLSGLSDTLSISFGIDKSIQVSRTKLKEYSGKKFIGGTNVDKREYKIEVKNTKQASIKLVLYDQIPISNVQSIEVEVKETSEAEYDKKTGQLTWKLDISPRAKIEKKIAYTVQYPKGTFINLD